MYIDIKTLLIFLNIYFMFSKRNIIKSIQIYIPFKYFHVKLLKYLNAFHILNYFNMAEENNKLVSMFIFVFFQITQKGFGCIFNLPSMITFFIGHNYIPRCILGIYWFWPQTIYEAVTFMAKERSSKVKFWAFFIKL